MDTYARDEQNPVPSVEPDVSASEAKLIGKLQDDALIILPVRRMVLFPGATVPIAIGRPKSVIAIEAAIRAGQPIGVVMQREAEIADPGPEDLFKIGTLAKIIRHMPTGNGAHHLICEGLQRIRLEDFRPGLPFLVARYSLIKESEERSAEIDARFLQLKERALEALGLLDGIPQDFINTIAAIDRPSALADLVAQHMDLESQEKQEILELQEIRRELGEVDGSGAELAELKAAIETAGMPDEARTHALKDLARLERIPEASMEYGMVRTNLETLAQLPWRVPDARDIDIGKAREILDEDHFGLEKIKQRILEFLAVYKLNPDGNSPILCFVGPPGVGKTSLGQSIARAMGRDFARLSLGGVHDEAEIRGHRMTYVGAMPGSIIKTIQRTGSRDCVLMLDEMDKLGASAHGDPASALLEVLDPAQNNSFRDNYLGVPFDLSKIVFIATANVLESIPRPLRDRMEVIELAGYTAEEKLEIARRYLVKRQLAANGLKASQCRINKSALEAIIDGYTREAGVRNLERAIGAVARRVAIRIAEGKVDKVSVNEADIHDILGPPRFKAELALRTSSPGVATGLAWTPVGGDILFIEATKFAGKGKLILTGQLGDVMRESAQAALSLVKARAAQLQIDPDVFGIQDLHIHLPAGAIPKDGPSAGVALFIALVSLFKDECVRSDTAMTGEISLRGLVLPVGGIKEKVIAAERAGVKRVMLPAENQRDFEDIPESVRKRLEFIWLQTVDDAIGAALKTC